MIIKSVEEMDGAADEILGHLRKFSKDNSPGARLLLLSGELGAGKTTFVQALARKLGVTERVTSPTFVIQKEYSIKNDPDFKRLIHIDAYRLESLYDLKLLGWDDYINDGSTIVALEWPERVGSEASLGGLSLKFRHIEGGRELTFEQI